MIETSATVIRGTADSQINVVKSMMSNFFGGDTEFNSDAPVRNRVENKVTLNNGDKRALRRL